MTSDHTHGFARLLSRLHDTRFATREVDLAADECEKLEEQNRFPASSVSHDGVYLGHTARIDQAPQFLAAYVEGTQMYLGLLLQVDDSTWMPSCSVAPWMLRAIGTRWQREAEEISWSMSSIDANSVMSLVDGSERGPLEHRINKLRSDLRDAGLLPSGF